MRHVRLIALPLVVLVAASSSSSAGAANQVGEIFAPDPITNCGDVTWLQAGSPDGRYAAPSDGVLTSWSFLALTPAPQVRLKVARAAGGLNFTVLGESGLKSPVAGTVNTYTDIRLPMLAGDVIGFYVGAADPHCGRPTPGYSYVGKNGDQPPSNTPALFGDYSGPSFQLDIAATLEPDADNDGFGDETQDQCPTDASTQNECVPPDTTITHGPKDKTKKKQATFKFSSNEPGTTFQCSLDGGAFAPCTSPDAIKVKKGKHTFAVRAKDVAGNLDASPASDDWKVKKKKK